MCNKLPCGHVHAYVEELKDIEDKWGMCLACHLNESDADPHRSRRRTMNAVGFTIAQSDVLTTDGLGT